jgi:hypothetical protein
MITNEAQFLVMTVKKTLSQHFVFVATREDDYITTMKAILIITAK